MTPIQQLYLGVGAKKKTYLDDVFSTYVYTGNGGSNTINSGLDMSGEGGLLWIKDREQASAHRLLDTIRGVNKPLKSEVATAQSTQSYNQAWTSTGSTINTTGQINADGIDYTSWSFRKAPGFFDVISWSADSGNNTKTLNHNLGSVPGLIIFKKYDADWSWVTWHRDSGDNTGMYLNTNGAEFTNADMSVSNVTSTQFTVGGDHNGGSGNYIAYVFAGGESTAATARSVDFDGTGDAMGSDVSSNYVIGTSDFTLEFWIKMHYNFGGKQAIISWEKSSNAPTTPFEIYGQSQNINFGTTASLINKKIASQSWNHIALVRSSGTTTMYVNGTSAGTYSDSNNYDSNQMTLGANGVNVAMQNMSAWLSNVRLVVGTAVYTSSFRPPTEPLTNITNTKFLALNGSSTTSATVGTIGFTEGNLTASTDSPFDDPAALTFGDSKEGIIKCGTYLGNGSSTGPEINLGFEPQWVLIKNTGSAESWVIYDSMRGIVSDSNDPGLYPDTNNSEYSDNIIDLTSTGFKLVSSNEDVNENDKKFIYVCIRRSDGYVGKPADSGTDVFAMDTGAGSSTSINFDSGFPVDFATVKKHSTSGDWYTAARKTGKYTVNLNSTGAQYDAGVNDWVLDHNSGWNSGNTGYDSTYQSWMWKRHAGFDVVTYDGNGSTGHVIPHNLSKIPEMMWIRRRDSGEDWEVYHKGLNGGTNPQNYGMKLNNTTAEHSNGSARWDSPTATHITVNTDNGTNNGNGTYLMMLFASVDGISKVGYYTGTGSTQTITTGFQPRFLIIRRTDDAEHWNVYDTTRGWESGNDKHLRLNANNAQITDEDHGAPTSTGFTVENVGTVNVNGGKYIYYAHA